MHVPQYISNMFEFWLITYIVSHKLWRFQNFYTSLVKFIFLIKFKFYSIFKLSTKILILFKCFYLFIFLQDRISILA